MVKISLKGEGRAIYCYLKKWREIDLLRIHDKTTEIEYYTWCSEIRGEA